MVHPILMFDQIVQLIDFFYLEYWLTRRFRWRSDGRFQPPPFLRRILRSIIYRRAWNRDDVCVHVRTFLN